MPRITTIEELMRQTAWDGECQVWTGTRYPRTGYGQCYVGAIRRSHPKYVGAHRLAWSLSIGPIPDGMIVMHKCDNPPCVRIEHLRLGTPADNMIDKSEKGRSWRGDKHHRSTMTGETVRLLRASYGSLPRKRGTISRLAREFGISFSAAYQAITKSSWRHIA